MSSTLIKINEPVKVYFTVIDPCDGFTPLSGVLSSISAKIYFNGALSALSNYLYEIGTSGTYYLIFTPDVKGEYYIRLMIGETRDVYDCELIASEKNLDDIYNLLTDVFNNSENCEVLLGDIINDLNLLITQNVTAQAVECS